MSKLAEIGNVTVITSVILDLSKNEFAMQAKVRIGDGNLTKEVEVVRKGSTLEEAESLALSRAEDVLGLGGNEFFTGLQKNSFTLRTECATVVLKQAVRNPTTGKDVPAKTGEQVSVDLVLKDLEGKITKQVVVRRIGNSIEEAEESAMKKAFELIGIGG